jgi:hypothetical protein
MRQYVLGLIGLTLLGGIPVWGQTPTGVPQGTPVLPPGVPAGTPVVIGPDCGGCCIPTKTVCVPECYTKKTTKVVYSSGCESRCLCYYRSLFRHCGCDSGHCERPITVRYLIKKVRTCEEEATKCVPAEVPGCASGHCCPGAAWGAPVAAPAPAGAPVRVTPSH